MRGWLLLSLCALGCATTQDAGTDTDRFEARVTTRDLERWKSRACGADVPGDLVLLDARTGGPVTCLPVTVTREPMTCTVGAECPSEVFFAGLTSQTGQLKLIAPVEKSRLTAVADGFAPSALANATSVKDRVLELELMPADGFWLKVLDADGNYLQDLSVSFKQGDEVIAQLRSNTLANVFFTQRQPFAGQPVTVEAQGFRALTINSVSELGDDGHTLTLAK